jgi:NAD(P)-dependent dehydrogenase (short-subunit alcohol dehydrogenase family)
LATDRADSTRTVEAIRAECGRAEALAVDLNAAGAPAELAAWAGDVDAAVLAAGIYRAVDWDDEDWPEAVEATIATNLVAPMRLAREIVGGMAGRGSGRLVLVGSVVATTAGRSRASAPITPPQRAPCTRSCAGLPPATRPRGF